MMEKAVMEVPSDSGPARPDGRGCLYYGCLAAAVAAVVGVILIAAAVYWGKKSFDGFVNEVAVPFSEQEPLRFAPLSVTPEEYGAVRRRVEAFIEAVKKNEPAELELSAPDINALISREDKLKEVRDYLRIAITEDKISGEISLPLGLFPIERLRDRYLNASALFSLEKKPGDVLMLRLQELRVKGKPLPEDLMTRLRTQNLSTYLYDRPEHAEFLKKLSRVEVREGKVILSYAGEVHPGG